MNGEGKEGGKGEEGKEKVGGGLKPGRGPTNSLHASAQEDALLYPRVLVVVVGIVFVGLVLYVLWLC